ncbi:hypothetical protein tpqmel_1004, partial [Candidatus Gastranaerophilus sp. (ex Termes propinquus)]
MAKVLRRICATEKTHSGTSEEYTKKKSYDLAIENFKLS